MAKKALVVCGLGWGDEGKGATVDKLVDMNESHIVIRYNGGSQTAHNVVFNPPGSSVSLSHTFSQFSSGSFHPKVTTWLSRFMLINPINMMNEADHLKKLGVPNVWERTFIDENCIVITPYHIAFGRVREILRGDKAHGSCGEGVGEARWQDITSSKYSIHAKDLDDKDLIEKKLMDLSSFYKSMCIPIKEKIQSLPEELWKKEYDILDPANEVTRNTFRDWYIDAYAEWPVIVSKGSTLGAMLNFSKHPCVFEGAQGVLLDEVHGVAPHNTWTNTTCENALTLLSEAKFDGEVEKVGCLRIYATRHGYGPFSTEDPNLNAVLTENHNKHGKYQGAFRFGHFDVPSVKSSIEICKGIDWISLSCIDQWNPMMKIKVSEDTYVQPETLSEYLKVLQENLSVPIKLIGSGPSSKDRISL